MDRAGIDIAARQTDTPVHHGWLRPRRLLVVFDAVSAIVTLVCLPLFFRLKGVGAGAVIESAFIAVGIMVVVTVLLVFRDGQYSVGYRMARLADVGNLIKNLLIGLAVAALLYFVTKGFFTGSPVPSRTVLSGTVLVFFVLTAVSRLGLATYQRSQFLKGKGVQKVLILGTGGAADDLFARIERYPWMGVRCAGRLVYGSQQAPCEPLRADAICLTDTFDGLESLDRALRISGAAVVLVALDDGEQAVLPHVIRLLSLAHVPYKILPSLFEPGYVASSRMEYADLPSVLQLRVDPLDRAQLMIKRMLDVALSAALMVIILPLTGVLTLLIKLDSPGPVFYKQERVGRNGRPFLMYKFRTMVKSADALLDQLTEQNEAAAGNNQIFKMKNDPRITRVGRFLRKFSLDELPQVFNVWKGEMSLVGPRPPLPREVENYEPQHLCRLKGMPGITGLWQVSGRSELSFEEMVRLDKYYLDNWTVFLDLSILVKTFFVVISRKGAY